MKPVGYLTLTKDGLTGESGVIYNYWMAGNGIFIDCLSQSAVGDHLHCARQHSRAGDNGKLRESAEGIYSARPAARGDQHLQIRPDP